MTESPEPGGQRRRRFTNLRDKPDLYFRSVDGDIRRAPSSRPDGDRGALSNMVQRTLERVRRSISDRSGS